MRLNYYFSSFGNSTRSKMMCWTICIVCLAVAAKYVSCSTAMRPRIAIIGGGMGGASAAFHITGYSLHNAQVTLFEEKAVLGGRVATVNVFGNEYETGGSIIHPKNELAVDLMKQSGLREKKDAPGGVLSLMDKNQDFVFSTSSWTLMTIWKIFQRYGFDFNRLRRMTNNFIDEFQLIYKLQSRGNYYDSVEKMLKAMSPNLYNLTQSDFHTFLIERGLQEKFIDEMVQAITYVNYGQNSHMHSLVGSVPVAGAANGLWSVECGNKHLPIALVNHTETRVVLNTKIQAIIQLPDGTLKLSTDLEGKSILAGNFDKVIIAAPMTSASPPIKFINFPKEMDEHFKSPPKYHRTVATIIAAKSVRPKYKSYLDIIAIEPNFFTSLSRIYPVLLFQAEKMPVFKVFSQEPLSDAQLDELFEDIQFKHVADWLAYPNYNQTPQKLGTFILHPKVYYLNTIEMAASAMEMILLSGRNAALHITSDFSYDKLKNPILSSGVNQKQEENPKTEL